MFLLSNLQKFALSFFLSICALSISQAAIPEKELLAAVGSKLNQLQTATSWKEFVKTNEKAFPSLDKGPSVVVDKLIFELDGETYTFGVGYRQVFLKTDIGRVKKILNSPGIWKDLYGLDADAAVEGAGDSFKARIFKKIPVVSDQDYVLDYKNFDEGGVWFQRAKQFSDKNEFALRDNLKALEKVDGGVVYREYALVYVLRWYLRALGPQMRSIMETELAKANVAFKCMAESTKEVSADLAKECAKLNSTTK